MKIVVPSVAIRVGLMRPTRRLEQREKNYVNEVYRCVPGDPAHYGSALNESVIIQKGYDAGLSPAEFVAKITE